MGDANACISPLLGLPQLDVVDWPEPSESEARDERNGLHWKTRPLVAWASGRPFAWVDDEITDADRAWVAAHHPGRALLHRVDPCHGITDGDYTVLDSWLRRPSRTEDSRRRRNSSLSGPSASSRPADDQPHNS
jgi:hypothetical protein